MRKYKFAKTFILSIFFTTLFLVAQNISYASSACNEVFVDVKTDNVFCNYIEYLFHQNVISHNQNFNPDENITKAQLLKLISVGFKLDKDTDNETVQIFPDVEDTNVFFNYINSLANHNILPDLPSENLYPASFATRDYTITVLAKALSILEEQPIISNSTKVSFSDLSANTELNDYVNFVLEQNPTLNDESKIISGFSDGTFRPNDLITRAQAAKLITNAMKTAGINLVACELEYCQDMFIAEDVNRTLAGQFFSIAFDGNWNDKLEKHVGFFETHLLSLVNTTKEQDVNSAQITSLYHANQRANASFFAYDTEKESSTSSLEDALVAIDPNKLPSQTFGELLASLAVSDGTGAGETKTEMLETRTIANGFYVAKLKMSQVASPDGGLKDIYAWLGTKVVKDVIYISIIQFEEDKNAEEMLRLFDGFSIV